MVNIQPENITLLIKNLKLSGRPDLAVAVHKKITQLQPNSPSAWYGLGKMQSYDRDYAESYRSFEMLLTLAPKSLIARVVLTQYDLQNGDKQKALKRAKELVKTHPQITDSYDTLGDVHISLGNPDKAIKQYQQAVKLKSNTATYIKLFSAYNRNKQFDLGYQQLKKWVEKYPDDYKLKEVLAITYQRRGEFKRAQKLYQQIVKKQPKKDRAFNNLALVSLQLKNPMSMEYADIAYNINAKNPLNLDTLGWVHLNNNNIAEALKHLGNAVEMAPGNPDFRYHYAVALNQAGQKREAKNQLALIVEIEGAFNNRSNAKELYKQLIK